MTHLISRHRAYEGRAVGNLGGGVVFKESLFIRRIDLCMEPFSPSTATASSAPVPVEEIRSLKPSIRTVWAIKRGAAAAIVTFAVFFYDLTHLFGASDIPFGIMTGGIILLGLLYTLLWPRLLFRSWGFSVRPEEIYIERGVLNHIRTIVPLRRIQHVDVSQDLLEREFSLGRLVVHTAGSRSSDVVIPGLNLNEAERIRDKVKQYILEDPLMEDPV